MVRDRNRKNYWPSLMVTMMWWLLVILIMFLVDPAVVADFPLPGTYGVFFFFLFLATWFTLSLILINTRRGLFFTIGIIIGLYLQLWKVLTWFNLILLIGSMGAFEYYFNQGKKQIKEEVDSSGTVL